MKILEEEKKVEREELIKKVGEHPGVVLKLLESMVRGGEIKIEKKKVPHSPKKFVVYYSI